MKNEEHVLVVERRLLDELGSFQGLQFDTHGYIAQLLKPENYSFVARSLAGRGMGGSVLGLGILEDGIADVGEATVDALEVREQIKMDRTGLIGLSEPGIESRKVPVAQLVFVLIDPLLMAK